MNVVPNSTRVTRFGTTWNRIVRAGLQDESAGAGFQRHVSAVLRRRSAWSLEVGASGGTINTVKAFFIDVRAGTRVDDDRGGFHRVRAEDYRAGECLISDVKESY